jgi:hypothetical protein
MAITLDCSPTDSITLSDFVDLVHSVPGQLNLDRLAEIAPNFVRLSRNRQFLSEVILRGLKDLASFQKGNGYTAQTLMLAEVPGRFYVRANVWLPEHLLHKGNLVGESKFFSFDYPHDHNFDFLTVGYLGNGYETDIFERPIDGIVGVVGEHVELRFLETTTLPQHKVMMYRAGHDVHIQKLPKEFSISLNLLLPSRTALDQFSFDLELQSVTGVLRSTISGQQWFVQTAGHLCDDNISDVLFNIAVKHPVPRMRDAARCSLAIRWPQLAGRLSAE